MKKKMKACFLCDNRCNVLDFDYASFKKCSLMLLFRRKKKYKYHDTLLTIESTDDFGYHTKCLKKITVLKQKDKEEFEDFCNSQTIPSLPSDLHEQSIPAVSCDLEESRATLNDQLVKLSVDEQYSTTASNEHPTTSEQEDNHSLSFQNLLSAATTFQQAISSTTKTKKLACLFCDHVEKKVGKRRIYVTLPQSEARVETIKSMAEKSNDLKLLAKLESPQSVAYHSTCLSSYQISLKRQCKEHPEPRYWHKNRQFHQSAFNAISEIIKAEIIEKNCVMYLTDLLSQYKSLLLEFAEGQVRAEDVQEYRGENLENKITKAFGDRITVESSMGTPKRKIVYQYDMDTSRLAAEIAKLQSTKKNRCRDGIKNITRVWSQTRDSWVRTLHDNKNSRRYIYHKKLLFLKDVVTCPDKQQDIDITVKEERNTSVSVDSDYSEEEEERSLIEEDSENVRKRRIEQVDVLSTNDEDDRTGNREENADRLIAYVDKKMSKIQENFGNRHMLFFKSVIPSIANFNDDQVLEFQSGVISLIRDLRKRYKDGV